MYATIKKIVLFSLGRHNGMKKKSELAYLFILHFHEISMCHVMRIKKIWDKSIISSIKPKFEDWFFVNLRVV